MTDWQSNIILLLCLLKMSTLPVFPYSGIPVNPLVNGSPTPGLQTRSVFCQELGGEWCVSKQNFICIYNNSPSFTLPPELSCIRFAEKHEPYWQLCMWEIQVVRALWESSPNHPLSQSLEKLSSTKQVPDAKNVGDCFFSPQVSKNVQMFLILDFEDHKISIYATQLCY